MKKISTLFFIVLAISNFLAQTTITIGTGTDQNTSTTYPAPYGNWYHGAKHQMLITASELTAAGAGPGNITSLAFDVVTVEGTPLEDFEIKLKNTNSTSVSSFETGLTTVYTAATYTELPGWNTHTFASSFYWDGISNLLVETCFNNTSFTNNAVVNQTTTSFNSTGYFRADAPGVCSTTSAPTVLSMRPNMQFSMQPAAIPPVTDFNASSTNSCSTTIIFYDQSSNSPTSWLWDFGDGNTSTQQNPTHTYSGNGTYTVTLTATNQYGSDTETKTNYITINASGNAPIAASCTPVTQNGTLGFGITNVTLNTINSNTGNASEGYTDVTCSQTTLFVGHSYSISINHSSPTTHNCAAWIDFNNDGIFNPTTEEIISSSSSLVTSGTITVPSTATLNTPLRMRVIADYDLSPSPTPCGDPEYGQAEDYTIVIELDSTSPTASFTSDVTYTCSGTVNFTDLSTNLPYGWGWDFGDGNTSVQQNPTHTYLSDGTFTVTLVATNQFGSDDTVQTNLITVATSNSLAAPSCEPQTLGTCCDYGIYGVQLGTINYFTDGAVDGYQDYSCEHFTELTPGSIYTLNVRTGPDNPQDTKVWIDYNNDGSFDNSELILESYNESNPTTNYTVPSTGITTNTRLRMRVSSEEVGSTFDGCTDLLRGQVEDYAVEVIPVSIEEIQDQNLFAVNVYPNPTNGLLFFNILSNTDNTLESIQVYDLIGKQILSSNVNSGTNSIDLGYLPKGTYIVIFTSSKGNLSTQKLIKK